MKRAQHGFTLVELIISITLVGILAVVAVPMVRTPMAAYMDATHRAELAAQLDTSVAKMRDDLALALPNSIRVRVVGQRRFLEFMPVRASGRYRSVASALACPNDKFEPSLATESCFTALGPLQLWGSSAPVAGSDWVVVNPINSVPPTVVSQDPYFGGATAPPNGVKSRFQGSLPVGIQTRITITPHLFPADAASRQFYIVSTPVSYECNPATGQLTRYDNYAIAAVQPIVFPAGSGAPLSTLIGPPSAVNPPCEILYTRTGALGRGGVVSVRLRFTLPAAGTGVPETIESFSVISVREPA